MTAGPDSRPVPTPLERRARLAAGVALVCAGAGAGAALALGEPALVQFDSNRPSPTAAGAAAVALWGAALLCGARPRVARACAGLGAAVAAGAVAFGERADFAVAVACGAWAAAGGRGAAAAAALGAVPGALALFGPLGWPVLGAAAVAVGCLPFLLGGTEALARALSYRRALPVAVAVTGACLTGLLAHRLRVEQAQRIQRQVQFETDHVHRLIRARVEEEVRALARTAADWEKAPDPEAKRREAANFIGQRPGAFAFGRVAVDGFVAWDQSTFSHTFPNDLTQLGAGAAVREAVRDGRETVARLPRSAFGGQRAVLLFAPAVAGRPEGGTVCAIRAREFFGSIVNPNVAPGYALELTERDEVVFDRHPNDTTYRADWHAGLGVSVYALDGRVEMWPTDDALAREHLSRPLQALLIGALGTALLVLAAHLAQTARRRTAALEEQVRERAAAQAALKRSEEQNRSLIENLGQAIFLQDLTQRYVAANPQFCRDVGRTEGAVLGATDADLFDPGEAALLSEEVRSVLATGKRVEGEREVGTAAARRCVRRVLTPVRDAGGRITGVLGIGWDVTEQRRLEAHLNQASKMDAIGQLAGGIAHDFNNLLTAVIGNLEILRETVPADGPAAPLVGAAHRAAERAAALTQRLLGFARRHQLDWRPVQANAVVAEVVALLERTIDPLIEIETRCAPDLWPVVADPAQLNQVLMNLCLNARDAIAGPGRITIETARAPASEVVDLNRTGGPTGDFVRLRVADTGCGMTPEVRAKIYEPFFTTKDVGKGTGLGLAMVFAIVRQHKGWIDCWTEVGAGTRFDVYLPRAAPAKPPAPAARPAPSRAGQGTVLVADDEELVRAVTATALEQAGYTVLRAANGREAVDLYAAERDRVVLVVLDLTMPVLSGHGAFRELLALNPKVRVLFVSGYSAEQLTDIERERMVGFLKKPYRPSELLVAVESALRARPSTSEFTLPARPGA